MTYIELGDGTLLNSDNIVKFKPMPSGHTRVWYVSGAHEDLSPEYAEIVKKHLHIISERANGKRNTRKTAKSA